MSNLKPDDLPKLNRPKSELRSRANYWYQIAFALAVTTLPVSCFLAVIQDGIGHARASRRSQCKNNLKVIGLALHNYHDKYGCFPPAYVADQHGRPMHSWRVLILPFIDQTPLYKTYHFDEPWDGPHNRQLADTILPIFNCPSDEHGGKAPPSTTTDYLAIIGPETAWPEGRAMSFADFKDGTSNTLLVVEVANSGIHWMEPRDLHVLQMAPTINAKAGQGISSRHVGGAHVLIGDGSVRYVSDKTSGDALRAWLTASAGDQTQQF